MNPKDLSALFVEAKKSYRHHPFFSVLIPVISSTRIARDDSIRTACIRMQNGNPVMSINKNFCAKYVKTLEDVLFLLSHEICHFVYGHLLPPMLSFNEEHGPEVTNLALDIIIDQMLYKELGEKQNEINLIRYYKYSLCPITLLFPPSQLSESDFKNDSCKELYRQLKRYERFTPYRLVQHIASHQGFSYPRLIKTYGVDIFMRARALKGGGQTLQPLVDLLLSRFRGNQTAFRRLEAPKKESFLDIIRALFQDEDAKGLDYRKAEGPIPFVGRKDLFHLATGRPNLIYHGNPDTVEERGLKVYFDVSGSMSEHIPKVLALIDQIKDYISYPLFAFSVGIHPVTRKQLMARQIVSTGGTDFDILAEHIIRNRHEKVLLITDGVGDISESLASQMRRNHRIIALFSGSGSRNEVEKFSERVVSMG